MRRAIPADRLRAPLGVASGLTTEEARARALAFGANDIVEVVADRWRLLLRETVRDPMIWFLVGTSALYFVLGDRAEAFTLLAALLPLVGMDAFLHRRTQASTEGLSSRLASTARLLRDGREQELPASAVVPGDTAIVGAGEAFPADGVITGGEGLQVDESALTGEAYPVPKTPLPTLPAGAEPMVDGTHLCFAGTRLLTGRARAAIAFTGGETLYGEIVRSATGGAQARTPLQAAVARLVLVMVAAATLFCLLLAGVRLWQGHGWLDALVSAVTLAVAALPEEFPVALTFFLGVGVYRLARRRALVRRAVSVENVGRVTAICSDKTGTITEGRLRLARVVPAEDGAEALALRIAALASRRETGDPLDDAILEEAGRAGHAAVPALATHPFTESRRRETAVVRDGARVIAATKGSPEAVLPMTTLTPPARAAWEERVARLAGGGQKVIACAWRAVEEGARGEPEGGYAFAGLVVCEDPVREGVPEAVASCRRAGIHVVMVTGDHVATARAVARAIGLGAAGEPRVVSADELDGAGRGARSMREVDAIARAVPAQKVGLVRALQAEGEVVAVTGDGVNDVPALQAADVGIAMGERGTRSARETAAIVLLDDNFRTIVRAIAEGRQLFRNLQLAFHYLLVVHIPFVLTATLIPLLGYPLLYLPIHIVLLETIIHPTAMLAFQELPAGEGLIRARPRREARFFDAAEWGVIAGSGLLLAAAMIAAYDHALGTFGRVGHARSLALAVFCLGSAACGAALSRLRTAAARAVTLGTAAASVALIQVPALAAAVHVEPLHLDDWGVAAAASIVAVALPRLAQESRAFFGRPQFLPAGGEPRGPKGPSISEKRASAPWHAD